MCVCVAAAAVALAGTVGAGALLRDGAAREAAAQAAVSRLDGARQLLVHRATRPTQGRAGATTILAAPAQQPTRHGLF